MEAIDFESVTPVDVWRAMDPETRRLAATAMFKDPVGKQEANLAICAAIRFRESAVKQLPVSQRVGYLLKAVRVDDAMASSMLLALHINERSDLLELFLDDLGIPNEGGMIDEDHDLQPPKPDHLQAAVRKLRKDFDDAQVDLYLTTLVSMDRETWAALIPLLQASDGPAPAAGESAEASEAEAP